MPEQPRDPRHYEMRIPPEPDQATLKKGDLKKPVEDENKDDSNTAKDTIVAREGDKPQAARGGK
jgi:hypothetical protein